jgi:hypothetical protein
MAFKKKDLEAVTVDAYLLSPGTIHIEWFLVPKELRRQGIGMAAYEEWERRLPKSVRLITLNAADAGSGYSGPFWERLGFVYRWDFGYAPDVSDPLYEDSHVMIKGIHGMPTPKTFKVNPEEAR